MLHTLITLSRLILAPFCFIALKQQNFELAIFMIVYAIISDVLDGKVARYFNKASKNGAIFDVVADKIFLYFCLVGLKSYNHFLKIILIIWLFRDLSQLIMFYYSKNEFKSIKIGKIYTGLQFCFVFLVNFIQNQHMIIFSACIFSIFSILSIKDYYKAFFNEK